MRTCVASLSPTVCGKDAKNKLIGKSYQIKEFVISVYEKKKRKKFLSLPGIKLELSAVKETDVA